MMIRLLALVVLVFSIVPVFAQEEPVAAAPMSAAADLSAGFPTAVIDTVVLPVNKAEVGLAAGYLTDGFVYETGVLEVTYGFLANLQGTAKWPLILGEGRVEGNADTTLAVLWAAMEADGSMPALGLEVAGRFPTGYGFTGYDGSLTGVATFNIADARLHVNAGITTIGNNESIGDFCNRSHTDSFKVGVDYMVVDNTCLIVDAFSNMAPWEGADRLEGVEVGVRAALTDVDVLSVGIGGGIGNGNVTPDFTATVGYQRAL
jgi:hypothetical protein